MGAQGTATLDFGSAGATDTSVVITGQGGILAGSLVEAWIVPAQTSTTADPYGHTPDEHLVVPMDVMAGNIVAGTGFTIYAVTENARPLFGKFNVGWVWN